MAFDQETDFFSGEKIDEIVLLRLKEKLFLQLTEWEAKQRVFDYFDFVSGSKDIKVIIIKSPYYAWHDDYLKFYSGASGSLDITVFHRMFNAVNQFILSIVASDKIVLHAAEGDAISMLFSVSLACDYDIISENAVLRFPHLQFGLVPKGGIAFFLSRTLGLRKASEILLSGRDIPAREALRLGIVDEIVPSNKLKESAFSKAREFSQQPSRSLSGIKRLLNHSLSDLKGHLDLENMVLLEILRTF